MAPERRERGREDGSRIAGVLQLVAMFVLALLPRLASTGRFIITDSVIWQQRTDRFSSAIASGRFSDATASFGGDATMPGGTTMWIGTFSRLVHRAAEAFGLAEDTRWSTQTYHQVGMAVATALLVVLIAVLAARWAGWGAGAVAGILFATEPWIVGHGAVTQTDALTAMFGIAGLLALGIAFDTPSRRPVAHPLMAAAAAGALIAASPMTKVNGAAFGVGAAAIVATSIGRAVHRGRHDGDRELVGLRLRQSAMAASGAAVAIAVLWPALVASPGQQIPALLDSIALGGAGHAQFYRGTVTHTPGAQYYAVVLPLRVTPWLLITSLAVPLGLCSRATRSRVLWVIAWALPPTFALSTASKQMDRYGLTIIAPLIVAVGVALGPHLERLLEAAPKTRIAAAAVAVLLFAHSLSVAPYGLLYFNPLLGGSERATKTLMVGWGEGLEVALEKIREMEGGDCSDVTVGGLRRDAAGTYLLPTRYGDLGFPCAASAPEGQRPTYVIAYVNQTQRTSEQQIREVLDGREKVGEVEIRGIEVATIWR